jgi:hypothetical protein
MVTGWRSGGGVNVRTQSRGNRGLSCSLYSRFRSQLPRNNAYLVILLYCVFLHGPRTTQLMKYQVVRGGGFKSELGPIMSAHSTPHPRWQRRRGRDRTSLRPRPRARQGIMEDEQQQLDEWARSRHTRLPSFTEVLSRRTRPPVDLFMF